MPHGCVYLCSWCVQVCPVLCALCVCANVRCANTGTASSWSSWLCVGMVCQCAWRVSPTGPHSHHFKFTPCFWCGAGTLRKGTWKPASRQQHGLEPWHGEARRKRCLAIAMLIFPSVSSRDQIWPADFQKSSNFHSPAFFIR